MEQIINKLIIFYFVRGFGKSRRLISLTFNVSRNEEGNRSVSLKSALRKCLIA